MRMLCSPETLARRRKLNRGYTVAFGAMCLLTLLVYVAECLLTRTGNMAVMLRVSYISMIGMGFACILFLNLVLSPSRRKETHLEGLLSREPEVREGRFFLTGASFRIPKSVRVYAVRLETGEDPVSLNLDEEWLGFAPPDGTPVRLQAVGKFIVGMEVPDSAAPDPSVRRPVPRKRGVLQQLVSLFPVLVIWVMLVLMIGGFVFNQITDVPPGDKIVIYADCGLRNAPELAEALEKKLGGAVRMVKIHPFSYAMFDTARISRGDLYLVPDSRKGEYRDWFTQEEGRIMYDPSSGFSVADSCFLYNPEGTSPEVFRLYTGASSVHLEDGLAARAAELLLSVNDSTGEEKP